MILSLSLPSLSFSFYLLFTRSSFSPLFISAFLLSSLFALLLSSSPLCSTSSLLPLPSLPLFLPPSSFLLSSLYDQHRLYPSLSALPSLLFPLSIANNNCYRYSPLSSLFPPSPSIVYVCPLSSSPLNWVGLAQTIGHPCDISHQRVNLTITSCSP